MKRGIISALIVANLIIFTGRELFPSASLSPRLYSYLKTINNQQEITVILRMNREVSPAVGKGQRSEFLQLIRNKANERKLNFGNYLQQKGLVGKIRNIRNFWLIEGMAVTLNKESLYSLMANPEIALIHENFVLTASPLEGTGDTGSGGSEWGIEKIGASRVWSTWGINGNGIRVGHLDTGVDPQHPDLAGKIRLWAEFDAYGNQLPNSVPHDSGTHGTHTAGTIVGGNASGKAIGVAPAAELIAALVLNGSNGTFAQVIAGMEWVIDPDENPRTDDGAQVLNMSLGAVGTYTLMIEPTDNLVAAGIVPVFSIGNTGFGTTSSPGNVPSAIGVGAVDSNNQVANFSSGGDVLWNYPPYVGNWLKPDFVAPGVNVKSAIPGGGYAYYNGTSMAAPHLSGVVALMLQANPYLGTEEIKQILRETVIDCGVPGRDAYYGWGLVDAYQAIVRVNICGTIRGVVRGPAGPLSARVTVSERGTTVTTNPSTGEYCLALDAGVYTLRVESYGYLTTEHSGINLAAGQVSEENFYLNEAPRGWVQGEVTDLNSGAGLSAQIAVINQPVNPVMSNLPDGNYQLELVAGEYQLKASRLGYATQVKNVIITENSTSQIDFSLDPLPPLLLVDDDGGSNWGNYENFYLETLDALGIGYTYWDTDFQGNPTADYLNQFPVVIWFTGNCWDTTLTAADQANLINYLNQGGNLFLTGQDIGWDIGNSAFYREYLRAEFKQDDTNLYQLQRIDTDFSAPDFLYLGGAASANNQNYPSEIEPLAGSQMLFRYLESASEPVSELVKTQQFSKQSFNTHSQTLGSGCAGLRYNGGSFRVIYFAFGFEGINTLTERAEVLSSILGWFGLTIPANLAVTSIDIDDDLNGESRGDANQVLDPGETVELNIGLRNLGSETATASQADLTINDVYITILRSNAIFGDIPGLASQEGTAFLIRIADNCPNGHQLRFNLHLSYNQKEENKEIVLNVQSAPAPPRNLWAQANPDGTVTLFWELTDPAEVAAIRIYSDRRCGFVDYQHIVAQVPPSLNQWTSPVLVNNAVYQFAARTVGQNGNEDRNTQVRTNVRVSRAPEARAVLKAPRPGSRICGDAVTIFSEVSGNIQSVQFQYRKKDSPTWGNITAPLMRPPYAFYWNTDSFASGEYELRALAVDIWDSRDEQASTIQVWIDRENADWIENGNPGDRKSPHYLKVRIRAKEDNTVYSADGTSIFLPAGAISEDKTLEIKELSREELLAVLPPADSPWKDAGVFRQFSFTDGTAHFSQPVTITLPYQDGDGDQIVDGSDVRIEDLRICFLEETSKRWLELETSYADNVQSGNPTANNFVYGIGRTVSAQVNHFTIFGLLKMVPQNDFQGLIVYPNPFYPKEADDIIFDGLPEWIGLQIFSVAGHIVREIETNTDGRYLWDVRNNEGEELASGVYIYLLRDKQGHRAKGKIAVIR